MFWRLKSKVILLIILETIDFIVKSIFIVGVCIFRGGMWKNNSNFI